MNPEAREGMVGILYIPATLGLVKSFFPPAAPSPMMMIKGATIF